MRHYEIRQVAERNGLRRRTMAPVPILGEARVKRADAFEYTAGRDKVRGDGEALFADVPFLIEREDPFESFRTRTRPRVAPGRAPDGGRERIGGAPAAAGSRAMASSMARGVSVLERV